MAKLFDLVKKRKIFVLTLVIVITFTPFTQLLGLNLNNDSVKLKSPEIANNSTETKSNQEFNQTNFPQKKTFQYEISTDYELSESMKIYFDKLVEFLKDNPEVTISITGYSDAEGTYEQKIYRSQKRALNAANYIKSKGIDQKRVLYTARPINPINEGTSSEFRSKKIPRIEIQILR